MSKQTQPKKICKSVSLCTMGGGKRKGVLQLENRFDGKYAASINTVNMTSMLMIYEKI